MPTSPASQADCDFGPYMSALQHSIKRAWFPPRGQESRKVSVQFKVHRDGSIGELKMSRSSGLTAADEAALLAATNAAPFRPLPPGSPDAIDIEFTFDYDSNNPKDAINGLTASTSAKLSQSLHLQLAGLSKASNQYKTLLDKQIRIRVDLRSNSDATLNAEMKKTRFQIDQAKRKICYRENRTEESREAQQAERSD